MNTITYFARLAAIFAASGLAYKNFGLDAGVFVFLCLIVLIEVPSK